MRRFKLLTHQGLDERYFKQGFIYNENYIDDTGTSVLWYATKGKFKQDWKEIFDHED